MELTINVPGGIVMNQTREAISQRQKKLLDYLKEHNTARVSDLCRHLDVSEITVRRDLNELENQKLLERFHGGARIKKIKPENDVAFEEKGVRHEAQKNAIGREAAHLVENGSTVFLNSGSTTLAALKYLNEKNVRIITNNALAPTKIYNDKIELILTGGECRCRSKSLIGDQAVTMVGNVLADICILGVNGISAESGTTTSIHQETAINDMMVKNCHGPVIVVADGSKIGRTYDFISIDISRIDILITDSGANAAELDKIREKGVRVIIINV